MTSRRRRAKAILAEGGKQPVDQAPADALPAFEPLKPIERNLSIFLTPVPANAQRHSDQISLAGVGLRYLGSQNP